MFDNERARELVERGIAAAKENRRDEARRVLERALKSEPTLRDMIRAWQYLSEISERPEEKRPFLEKMLAADPSDGYARRELAILNGHVNREDLVNPDGFVLPATTTHPHDQAQRFACSQCGSGRMVADPVRGDLLCQHCGHRRPIDTQFHERHRDVAATLWTAKGRSIPQSTLVFECKGCGASFLVAPEKLSANCPYCTTAYVVAAPESRELIEPDGIVPFAIPPEEARRALERESAGHFLSDIRGVYFPMWIFTFAGEVRWKGLQRDRHGLGSDHREEISGTYTVIDVRACVPASGRSPGEFHSSALEEFDFRTMIPYQPGQLADWPAETYQVSLETASVMARRMALPTIRSEAQAHIDASVENVEMSFAALAADSFRLVLLPLWLAHLEQAGTRVPVFVNGQSGVAHVPRASGFVGWLSRRLRP